MTADACALAEERKTAVHEAGHAVAAYLQNVPFERVMILSHGEFEQMERDPLLWATKPQGQVSVEHTRMLKFEADGVRRPTHDTRKAMDAYIVYSLAGKIAEAVLCGECFDGGNDTDMAKLNAELDRLDAQMREPDDGRPMEWPCVSPGPERNMHIERMRERTIALIRRYRGAVEAVAAALLERRVLSCTEVAVLVDRRARVGIARKRRGTP